MTEDETKHATHRTDQATTETPSTPEPTDAIAQKVARLQGRITNTMENITDTMKEVADIQRRRDEAARVILRDHSTEELERTVAAILFNREQQRQLWTTYVHEEGSAGE